MVKKIDNAKSILHLFFRLPFGRSLINLLKTSNEAKSIQAPDMMSNMVNAASSSDEIVIIWFIE